MHMCVVARPITGWLVRGISTILSQGIASKMVVPAPRQSPISRSTQPPNFASKRLTKDPPSPASQHRPSTINLSARLWATSAFRPPEPFSINSTLRAHSHKRVYNNPLRWTSQHLLVLDCQFDARQRNTTNDDASNTGSCHQPPGRRQRHECPTCGDTGNQALLPDSRGAGLPLLTR
ncbi:hypothetical protein B0T22DRAFT_192790 [Podospora appendiculata]|uniref:Uncharacterized protein n=1 Tax=Podospora appendiculata TaxID=314037 RepID=A0AAE0XDF6_9PEZI|nr:hypothetical protein B0T22DRAFT_192790 [Podospora appendiculata]